MNCACMLCSQNTEVVIRSIAASGFCVLKDRTEEDFVSVWIPWGKSEGAGSFSDEKRKGKKTMEIPHCSALPGVFCPVWQTARKIPRLSLTTALKVSGEMLEACASIGE